LFDHHNSYNDRFSRRSRNHGGPDGRNPGGFGGRDRGLKPGAPTGLVEPQAHAWGQTGRLEGALGFPGLKPGARRAQHEMAPDSGDRRGRRAYVADGWGGRETGTPGNRALGVAR